MTTLKSPKSISSNPATQAKRDARNMLPKQSPELQEIAPYSPLVTSGVTANPKVAAIEDAPNYAPSVSPSVACAKCHSYKTEDVLMGFCHKYDFYARGDFSCDAWTSRNSALLRKKLRGF